MTFSTLLTSSHYYSVGNLSLYCKTKFRTAAKIMWFEKDCSSRWTGCL